MRPSASVIHAPASSLVPPFALFFTPRRCHCSSPRHLHRSHLPSTKYSIRSRKDSFSLIRSSSTQQPQSPVFPGGYRRPEVKVPSILLHVDPTDVVPGGDALDLIDKAVSEVVSIVVLNGCNIASGKQLYDAACLIKSVVRDRAYFLIEERVDIASAVNASGVVLSDQGLPALVARNMIMDSKPDSVYFPLVAKKVDTLSPEQAFSHFEGADFLLYSPQQRDYTIQGTPKIPVFFANPKGENGTYSIMEEAANVSVLGGCGLALSLHDLKRYGYQTVGRLFEKSNVNNNGSQKEVNFKVPLQKTESLTAGFVKVEDKEKELVDREKALMHEIINVIQNAAPQMEEISLLVDAVAQIDDPFLLAIVGEFNSGKSTFINALLGEKYLKDGVVPTTNEITFLRHSDLRAGELERCERHPDGQYICYLPFPILKEINIVDTPGTNVILQRQQRLTEEFVPRADLLMFVLSSDRPLTESEVSFLRYTQQWKKKIVFVLNKSDLYNNSSELEEATSFVKENVRRLLNTGEVILYPVSSRSALEAKLSPVSIITNPNDRFNELEKYLDSFLDGSTNAGKERMKLKLETPSRIAERLLSAFKTIVKYECIQAKDDLEALIETTNTVNMYARKLESESVLQREKVLGLVDSTKSRVVDIIQSTLKLSNVDTVISYVVKGDDSALVPESLKIENDVVRPALSEAQNALSEYVRWLEENNAIEAKRFVENLDSKGSSFIGATSAVSLDTYEMLKRHEKASLSVLHNFNVSTKAFDKEIRELLLGTFGGLGAAGVSASLLTSVLPSTLEDVLALVICSAGGYLAMWSFPTRRKAVVKKIGELSDEVGKKMEEAMKKDVEESVKKMKEFVKAIGKPYIDAAQKRVDQLSSLQNEISLLEKRITSLQVQIQNLHVSS